MYTIISLGGSVIVPHLSDKGGINVPFLKKFRKLILEELGRGKKFIIVAGGGKTTRVYQRAAAKITHLKKEDLDWIGIHATRLNAHLLRTIFWKEAYPVILDNPKKRLKKDKKELLIASGWRPGWSTDYITVLLAQRFRVKEIINVGDISFIYSEDPKKSKTARPIKEISWQSYQRIIPKEWMPGLSTPFDPVATRLAKKLKLRVKIIKAENLENLKNTIEGKNFKGTVIM
jgi:uridylate kinase